MSQGESGEGFQKSTQYRHCVIVDDHRLFAESLKFALEREFGCLKCTVVCSAKEVLEFVTREKVDFLFVDVHLPDMNGIELTRRLLAIDSSLRVVILTVDDSPETAFQAIASGASGYLLKTSSLERMRKSLATILEGDVAIGLEVASLLLERLKRFPKSESSSRSPLLERLSPREKEVLFLVARGKDNRAIAQELFISEKTVKNHIARIMEKTGISSRLQLVVFAIQEGFLDRVTPGPQEPSGAF